MNNYLKVGLFAGIGILITRFMTWKNTTEMIDFRLSNPRIHLVDLKGIRFRSEIEVHNPTKNTLTVSKPNITLTSNGKHLASSLPQNKSYTFEPLSTSLIDAIEITVPWNAMGAYAINIFTKYSQIKAAFLNKDLKEIAKVIGMPLELSYTLYVGKILHKSQPEKIL